MEYRSFPHDFMKAEPQTASVLLCVLLMFALLGPSLLVVIGPDHSEPGPPVGPSFVTGARGAGSPAAAPGPSALDTRDGLRFGPAAAGPRSEHTLILLNNTLALGDVQPPTGLGPYGITYDAGNGYLYVLDFSSGNVSVLNGSNDQLVSTIPVGEGPYQAAVDSANGDIYVTNYYSDNVSVLSGTTDRVVATLAVGTDPSGIAVNSSTGYVYVTDYGSSTVSVLNASTNHLSSNISVGAGPTSVTIDGPNHDVYVTDIGPAAVSVISGTTNLVTATVHVGSGPIRAAVDGANGDVYVANAYSDNVSAISGSTNKVVATVTTGSFPDQAMVDPATGQIYVVNQNSRNVSVISGATNTLAGTDSVGVQPFAIALDTSNGDLYIPNQNIGGPSNVSVISGATSKVVATIGAGTEPVGCAVDVANGDVYVSNQGSSNVSVISGTTNKVATSITTAFEPDGLALNTSSGTLFASDDSPLAVQTISGTSESVVSTAGVGAIPHAIAYDPYNGEVYVADFGSHNVSVLSGATGGSIASIPVGAAPQAIAVDDANGTVYVANTNSNNLSVISPFTNKVTSTVALGGGAFPWELAVDQATGNVYTLVGGTTVDEISGSTGAVLNTITVGAGAKYGGGAPLGLAYDPANGHLYVLNWAGNTVSVLSGSTNTVVATVAVGHEPVTLAIDSSTGLIFVVNAGSNNVSVINGTTNTLVATVPVGTSPQGIAWDRLDGDLYVSNQGSNNLSVLNGATGGLLGTVPVGFYPGSIVADPRSGTVYVANRGGTLSIVGPTEFPVTFSETGLALGTAWAVTVAGTTSSSMGGLVQFNETIGTDLSYSVGGADGYTWSPTQGVFNVTGANLTVNITFTAAAGHYLVAFHEDGLPLGVLWSIRLNATPLGTSSGSFVEFSEPNATGFTYTVVSPAGFVPGPANGSFTVAGGPVNISVQFQELFTVTFDESGLSGGTSWSVVLNGTRSSSTSSRNEFNVTNGSYAFSVVNVSGSQVAPSSGRVVVSGAEVSVRIAFGILYPVVFRESGLRGGTNWSVTLSGVPQAGAGASHSFNETNGTYSYAVGNVSGYVVQPAQGSVNVAGAGATVTVTFRAVFQIVFQETGLVGGTGWSVTANGTPQTSHASGIAFNSTNGTVRFSIVNVSGYTVHPAQGSATVAGGNVTVPVVFDRLYSVRFEESGLLPGTTWEVVFNGSLQGSTGTSLSFSVANGTYPLAVRSLAEYAASPLPSNLTVDGAPVNLSVMFQALYSVTFIEAGLPQGSTWTVNLGGMANFSLSNVIGFRLVNGTYSYRVDPLPGFSTAWSGQVTVSGGNQGVTVNFTQLTYAVQFVVGGLPNGIEWGVTVGGVLLLGTVSTLSLNEPNGTYAYAATAVAGFIVPGPGEVPVDGRGATIAVTYAAFDYAVTFRETGLSFANVSGWSVTLDGSTVNGTSSTIQFEEPNGTYAYTVLGVPGYSANSTSGSLTVSGVGRTVEVGFTARTTTYSITFTEAGLPVGTNWGVSLNGTLEHSSTTTIVFSGLANATYSYAVYPVPDFGWSGSSNSVVVNGTDPAVEIQFEPSAGSGGSSGPGGLPVLDWTALLAAVAIAAVVVLLLLRGRGGARTALGNGSAATPSDGSELPASPEEGPAPLES